MGFWCITHWDFLCVIYGILVYHTQGTSVRKLWDSGIANTGILTCITVIVYCDGILCVNYGSNYGDIHMQ